MFGIAVEFVPPGMTPEEARRARKQKRGVDKKDVITLGVMVLALLALVGGGIWWWVGRSPSTARASAKTKISRAAKKSPQPAITTPQTARITATAVITASPAITLTPAVTPTLTVTATAPVTEDGGFLAALFNRPTATVEPIGGLFTSPISRAQRALSTARAPFATPTLPPGTLVRAAAAAPEPTYTPTATPYPYDYQVIANAAHPESLYSYVSGWTVEQDGFTPRPVAVRLRYSGGEMRWPRPNNTDVANGYYEFLVSPGVYWLQVLDGKSPDVKIEVGNTPTRREVSFRALVHRPVSPARSNPWYAPAPPPTPKPTATPTPIPTHGPKNYHIYLPIVMRNFSAPTPTPTATPTFTMTPTPTATGSGSSNPPTATPTAGGSAQLPTPEAPQ